MNIALIHYRVGETDGVSLEMDKWKKVLLELGHSVYYIAGNKGNTEARIIPELSLDNEEMKKIHYNAYYELRDYLDESDFSAAIEEQANVIEKQLLGFIEDYKIDILVPNNILSLGHHISAAIAIYRAAKKKNIKIICHHHDFYWERVVFNNPTCCLVKNILEDFFPPKDPFISHCVINTIAQNALKEKKKLSSAVIPNVYDFSQPLWVREEYNSDLRSRLGINDNDLFFLQATRITDRKAIELAVDLINKLDEPDCRKKMFGQRMHNGQIFDENSSIYLILPGLSGIKESATGYKDKLVEYAGKKVKLIWCNDILEEKRRIDVHGNKYYSLWDFYANCDFITYPSIQEGWGNQFLEGLFAKKPMVVFEYPVFLSDIKECGFNYISLGDLYNPMENGLVSVNESIIENAANECVAYLTNEKKYTVSGERNFKIGDKYFSLNALKIKLNDGF